MMKQFNDIFMQLATRTDISVVWNDFEENKEEYMKYFNQYLTEYDLAEYIK